MIYANNWREFQHYGKRRPPWIKLYRSLLDDVAYLRLPVASKALAPMLWLLASEHIEGGFTDNMSDLAYRLRMTEQELLVAIKPLIDNGFFHTDSTMLASCYQDARPETERETEAETKKSKEKRKPWELDLDDESASTTKTILSFWPKPPSKQPNDSPVPATRPALLAARLAELKGKGVDMSVCEAIARRFVDEYKKGGYMKAAQYFFGKDEDAPWVSYYRIELHNRRANAS